ncbi:MAG: hypothetical protein C4346_19845, partial [Chloroflexota bacterium]
MRRADATPHGDGRLLAGEAPCWCTLEPDGSIAVMAGLVESLDFPCHVLRMWFASLKPVAWTRFLRLSTLACGALLLAVLAACTDEDNQRR